MPDLRPVSRLELIRRLRSLGFSGPYSGGKHQFMMRSRLKLRVPNPHQGDVSLPLLKRILLQAGIQDAEWDRSDAAGDE
ncbi:MAG: type II toxin-antitoxin system HicA family toxin [Candidatus Riflebacteria bacterium]|nr:type II toxin-antitoxin system HicA family toxin [Candidatus Riflebacteria bacterium]